MGAAATVATLPGARLLASSARGSETPRSETLVATLFRSLTKQQRKSVCFGFDHPLRLKVDNNWQITDKKVTDFFNKDQQEMIRQIFLGLHSPEYSETVMNQVIHDSGKEGFGGCSIALFGEPGTGKFEFVLTGRHCTRRCDGDSVEGAAFGGPIFYGHAAKGFKEKPDHPGNAYWYQALQANEVFKMLDGKQREIALLGTGREEVGTDTVKLTGKKTGLPGIPMAELSRDQKDQVRKTLASLLAPFRKADAEEAMKLIEANGVDSLHMAFYKNQDIGNGTASGTYGKSRGRPCFGTFAVILTCIRGFTSGGTCKLVRRDSAASGSRLHAAECATICVAGGLGEMNRPRALPQFRGLLFLAFSIRRFKRFNPF